MSPFASQVGSFVGSSARNFGKFLKATGDGVLLCIDTWNGDILMILLENFIPHMGRSPSGESRLYYRFLDTMIKASLTTTVLPLRVSSITGARIVKTMEVCHIELHGEARVIFSLMWSTRCG